ncbi:glycine--tRNA ligase beta subunit [Alphaproteobacteria bacterium]|nr:glycine--tRNA ligase beta subunit [Alphaproteobacteria bacterium]
MKIHSKDSAMSINEENFLLELMVEEIPAMFQTNAIANLKDIITGKLEKNKIRYENVRAYITPRRMMFMAKLGSHIPAFTEEKKGPQTSAPAEVINKFLKSLGISRDDCCEKIVDKKSFIVANVSHPQQSTKDLLEDIVVTSIAEIQWKKSMHWRDHSFNFVRPIRNILCIFCDEHVKVEFKEINLQSNDYTFGHRFMSTGKISVKNPHDYVKKMKESSVIVDPAERKKIILDGFEKISAKNGVSIEITDRLLEEVLGLVENPVVLLGQIPEKFMKLPEEALITPMRVHQRYFPVRKGQKLAPFFALVSNNLIEDGGKEIIKGNERVLNARLSDALFFYETDLQKPLESHLENLKKIAFNEKLGTVFDRIMRICDVCDFVWNDISGDFHGLPKNDVPVLLKRTAVLSKCDLSTHMVSEFPELQGIMGSYYSALQGENKFICAAIGEQYKAIDEIKSPLGALFSLADKIEIITSFFAIGKEPTRSKDPFALRRAAIGLIRIIRKYNISLDLYEIIGKTFEKLSSSFDGLNPNTVESVYSFIMERLKVTLKESGIPHEIVTSVIAAERQDIRPVAKPTISEDFLGDTERRIAVYLGVHEDSSTGSTTKIPDRGRLRNGSINRIFDKANVLNQTLQSSEGESLVSCYRRSKNILAPYEKENSSREIHCDRSMCVEQCERDLLDALDTLQCSLDVVEGSSLDSCEKLRKKVSLCASIEKKTITFFEDILINVDDEKLRQNRINILQKLMVIFEKFLPEITDIKQACACSRNSVLFRDRCI